MLPEQRARHDYHTTYIKCCFHLILSFDGQTYHRSHWVKQILSTARHNMVQFAINKIAARRSKMIKERTVILNIMLLPKFPCGMESIHVRAVLPVTRFYTYVHTRTFKHLNEMFWGREFSIPYDLTCFSNCTCYRFFAACIRTSKKRVTGKQL